MAAWLGIMLSFCTIAGIAISTYSGAHRSDLVVVYELDFFVLNVIGLVLGFRRKDETEASPVKGTFMYGVWVGAIVAAVTWLYSP